MTTVLIVDDQPPFRLAARMAAKRVDGWTVVGEAATGEEGVSIAADIEPDLVLMDINLSDDPDALDGFGATRRITEHAPETVVFLVSTYAVEDLPDDVLTCGAATYISKEDLSPAVLAQAWAEASAPTR